MTMPHPFDKFKYCPKCGSNKFVEHNSKAKACKDCKFIYYFNSSASTIAIIINDKRELLVAIRAFEPAKGTYDLPGGFVDLNETGEEAVAREVLEETNLEVINVQYISSLVNKYIYSDFEVQTLDLVYKCEVKDFQKLKAEDDVASLEFKKIDELNSDDFGLKSVKEVITRIQKMKISL